MIKLTPDRLNAVVVFVTSGNDEKPKKNSSKKEPVVEKPKVKIINEDSKTRPYAIMINNINVARPLQSGLNDAYIIYEMIVDKFKVEQGE